jgi:hypothetical protein
LCSTAIGGREMSQWANSGQSASQQRSHLFDYLVGATGERERGREAEHGGGLEIDEQRYLCNLLHRQVGKIEPAACDGRRVCQFRFLDHARWR